MAEPVIMAVVPEPCGKRMTTPMMMGIRMAGMPVETIQSAIMEAAPVALMTAPRAPPAAVMKAMGPASQQACCIRSTQVFLSNSLHSRKAPMHSAMNRAITGWPRNSTTLANIVPSSAVIWLTSVLAKIRTMGTSRVAKDRNALGSFSACSSSAKSSVVRSSFFWYFSLMRSRTFSCASVYLERSISYGTTRSGYFLPKWRNSGTAKMNSGTEIAMPHRMNMPRSTLRPLSWKVPTTASGPGVGGTMKWVMYSPIPRIPPSQTMDFLVRRENSLAREDRITKPESQKTGMETTQPVRPRTMSQFFTPTALRMVSAMHLAAPLFSRKIPMMQPKPITMPMLVIVPPKPAVTVEIHCERVVTSPKGMASTAISTAEMISDGKACILVKMISSIMTMMPISMARTGFNIPGTYPLCEIQFWSHKRTLFRDVRLLSTAGARAAVR